MMQAQAKVILGIGLLLCATSAFAGSEQGSQHCNQPNLLQNADFESGSGALPAAWLPDAFISREGIFTWTDGEAFSGCRSVMLTVPADQPNDVRWIQLVAVKPNTTYRLTGWIKTEGVLSSPQAIQAGANLSILDQDLVETVFAWAGGLLGDNDWTYVEMTFNSRQKTEITIAARLGFYSGVTAGTAWFDKLRLFKVEPSH